MVIKNNYNFWYHIIQISTFEDLYNSVSQYFSNEQYLKLLKRFIWSTSSGLRIHIATNLLEDTLIEFCYSIKKKIHIVIWGGSKNIATNMLGQIFSPYTSTKASCQKWFTVEADMKIQLY